MNIRDNMTTAEISEAVENYDNLSVIEKAMVEKAILNNDEARSRAISGALMDNNMMLVAKLAFYQPYPSPK